MYIQCAIRKEQDIFPLTALNLIDRMNHISYMGCIIQGKN